jgi:hypothetical protein
MMVSMEKKTKDFVGRVLTAIATIHDTKELALTINEIEEMQRRGFTAHDASEYCECMEHVTPGLDKKAAGEKMMALRFKYAARNKV